MILEGTYISLQSFGLHISHKILFITRVESQQILHKLVNSYLMKHFNFELHKNQKLNSLLCRNSLISHFINNNLSNPQYEPLICSFFSHFYVTVEYDGTIDQPALLTINNKIYLDYKYQDLSLFSSTVLYRITQTSNPLLFEHLRSQNSYLDINEPFKGYLIQRDNGDSEYFVLPELSPQLLTQLSEFYESLLMIFGLLEFPSDQEEYAGEVFDYLLTMRNFFNLYDNGDEDLSKPGFKDIPF